MNLTFKNTLLKVINSYKLNISGLKFWILYLYVPLPKLNIADSLEVISLINRVL
jgi:hypothetical protein